MKKKMENREYLYDNKSTKSGFHIKITGDKEAITEVESFIEDAKKIVDNPFVIDEFIDILKNIKSENLFNPYTDICPENDLEIADSIRTQNLYKYLTVTKNAKILLIGEAPGYLGARRCGIPFTSEKTMKIASRTLGVEFEKATFKGKNKEISAMHVWEILKDAEEQPMIWNIIPMHPHKKNENLSNRTPTKKDYKACEEAINYLMNRRRFNKIYAVGKQAQNKLKEMKFAVEYIRHPSMGGSRIFKEHLKKHLSINQEEKLTDETLIDFFS